jgi:dTDP-4-amino-4,6-dideoxygalactose transaminase
MSTTLAIDGGTPLRSAPYPSWPQWGAEEERAVLDVLHSGHWWAPEGTQVKGLEAEFAAYQDARHAVAVTNGSAALEVCLMAAGLGWGDEVVTTPYTFIATANACLLVGAIPRFVDILPGTWNLDPAQVEAAITPRTKAIIPVHIGGEPADMDAIMDIARRHGLVVVEDACQAHAAAWRGRKVGAIGDMGCFSFQASKNITGGEGGLIITNDEGWAESCWSVANVGRKRQGEWYQHITLASNYRLSEWAGAVLRCQLSRLEEQAERRSANAAYLAEALDEAPGLAPLPGDPRVTRNAYHLFKIWYDPAAYGGRTAREFAAAMQAEGMPLTAGYNEPLSTTAVIVDRTRRIREHLGLPQEEPVPCPVAADACARGLWVRQSALLAEREDMDDIVRAANKIASAWK